MTTKRPGGSLRDRLSDHDLSTPLRKPAVLERRALRALAVLFLAAVAYGTVGPIGLSGGAWLVSNPNWQWLLPFAATDTNDIFTNIVVYLPVGFALRLLLRRRGRAGMVDLGAAILIAAGMSYATEVAQQFIPTRSASMTDVVVNTLAATLGSLVAPAVQRAARQGHARAYTLWHACPWILLGWLVIALTAVLMLQPFMLRSPSIDLELFAPLDLIDLRRFGMFLLIGMVVSIAATRERGDLAGGARLGLWRATWLAIGLELCQIVTVGHVCSPREMTTGVAGGAVGVILAIQLFTRGLIRVQQGPPVAVDEVDPATARLVDMRLQRWRPVLLVLMVAVVLAAALTPVIRSYHGRVTTGSHDLLMWLPFQAQFHASFHVVISDVIEALVLYGAVALLALALSPEHGRRWGLGVLLGGLTLSAVAQVGLLGRPLDVTPIGVALAAWILAGYAWRALQPVMAGHMSDEGVPAPVRVRRR